VKTKLALCLTLAAFGSALSSPVAAEPARQRVAQAIGADVLPAFEILTIVRSMGFDPISHPQRRGPYYVLNAVDTRGIEMRIVADARVGEVVSVMPAPPPAMYDSGPRIIHVPQHSVGALPDDPDYVERPPEERDPRQYDRPRQQRRVISPPAPSTKSASAPPESAPPAAQPPATAATPIAPVAPAPPRAVLTRPDSGDDGPTPIKPLPKIGKSERFTSPDPQATGSVTPTVPSQDRAAETGGTSDKAPEAPPPNKLIDMPTVTPLE